jgi:hypothetical protein
MDMGLIVRERGSPVKSLLRLETSIIRSYEWVIVFPVSGLSNGLPVDFKPTALICLQGLPLGKNVAFESFADRLIEKSGLTWPSVDLINSHSSMRVVAKKLLVDIMEAFGVLEYEYFTDTRKGYELI